MCDSAICWWRWASQLCMCAGTLMECFGSLHGLSVSEFNTMANERIRNMHSFNSAVRRWAACWLSLLTQESMSLARFPCRSDRVFWAVRVARGRRTPLCWSRSHICHCCDRKLHFSQLSWGQKERFYGNEGQVWLLMMACQTLYGLASILYNHRYFSSRKELKIK